MAAYDTLIPPLLAAVHAAGRRILKDWKQPIAVYRKPDDSPKTDTDDAAEAIVKAAILDTGSDLPIVAEEAISKGERVTIGPDKRFWLVDALDGTRDFIRGGADFSVNIALIENGEPVLGLIHAPVTGDTWYAQRDTGALHLKGGDTRPIAMRAPNRDALYVLGGKRSAAPETLDPVRRRAQHRRARGAVVLHQILPAGGRTLGSVPASGRNL
jgi:3'(2'), 5'-bisphosphate nucleotidase